MDELILKLKADIFDLDMQARQINDTRNQLMQQLVSIIQKKTAEEVKASAKAEKKIEKPKK